MKQPSSYEVSMRASSPYFKNTLPSPDSDRKLLSNYVPEFPGLQGYLRTRPLVAK